MIRKKQSQGSEDKTTADETVIGERCPLNKSLDNDLRIIAKNAGLTKCEQLEKFVVQGIEFKKLEAERAKTEAEGSVRDDKIFLLLSMYYRRNHASHLGADKT
jgi:hypothetical protein